MLKETDFKIDSDSFHFKQDSYPLMRITTARLKKLSLLDNLGQILFWVFAFSGALWLAIQQVQMGPRWILVTASVLTTLGFVVALRRCARFALQIEFRHVDETGVQWCNVAKASSADDAALLAQQAAALNSRLA